MSVADRWGRRILGWVDRVNRRRPWSHNDFYGAWLVRQARLVRTPPPRTALDVGCGTGNLLGRLGRVMDHVTGLEPDLHAATIAAARYAGDPHIRVIHGGFDDRPTGSWDLVSFVASLHHMPLEATLESVRRMVKPGGRLVVVGLSRDSAGGWSIASIPLNLLVGLLMNPRGDTRRPVSSIAATRDAADSLAEIQQTAQRILPGAVLHRGPFWRYTMVWHAPPDG